VNPTRRALPEYGVHRAAAARAGPGKGLGRPAAPVPAPLPLRCYRLAITGAGVSKIPPAPERRHRPDRGGVCGGEGGVVVDFFWFFLAFCVHLPFFVSGFFSGVFVCFILLFSLCLLFLLCVFFSSFFVFFFFFFFFFCLFFLFVFCFFFFFCFLYLCCVFPRFCVLGMVAGSCVFFW